MTDNSRGRFTVSLGRSGQVVNRGATASYSPYAADCFTGPGGKRALRDKLHGNPEDSTLSKNYYSDKRQREDNCSSTLSSTVSEDIHVRRDDLRYKLLRKDASRKTHGNANQKNLDLREKLSRKVDPPGPPPNSLDSRTLHMLETEDITKLESIPQAESINNLPHIDSSRNSHSPWSFDNVKGSPRRMMSTCSSKVLSPPRNVHDLYQRLLVGVSDDRKVSHIRRSPERMPPPSYVDDLHQRPLNEVFDDRRMLHVRQSPERMASTSSSRIVSPAKNADELHQRPRNIMFGDTRIASYMSNDVFDTPRSLNCSAAFDDRRNASYMSTNAFNTPKSGNCSTTTFGDRRTSLYISSNEYDTPKSMNCSTAFDDRRNASYMSCDVFDTPKSVNCSTTFGDRRTTSYMSSNAYETPKSMRSTTFDDRRNASYMSSDAFDTPKFVNPSTTFVTKPGIPSSFVQPPAPLLGQMAPTNGRFDDMRAASYMSNNVFDAPKPLNCSTIFVANPVIPYSGKPPAPFLGQVGPPSAITLNNSYGVPIEAQIVEGQPTVEGFLLSLGLGKYANVFKVEEVDMSSLRQMGEQDLKDMGIPLGPRRKIIRALMPPPRAQYCNYTSNPRMGGSFH